MKDCPFQDFESYIQPLHALPEWSVKSNKLCRYFELLLQDALPKGYIGPGDEPLLFARHIIDSLLPYTLPDVYGITERSGAIADLGSGAGLPGIVTAILFPASHVYLIDSARGRLEFAEYAAKHAGVNNVKPVAANLSLDLGLKADLATFRAFRKPLASLEYSLMVLKSAGKALYWRSSKLILNGAAEDRLASLGFSSGTYYSLPAPELIGNRGVYLFERLRAANGFPRSGKKIMADPLVLSVE